MMLLALAVGFIRGDLKLLTAAIMTANGSRAAEAGCVIEKNRLLFRDRDALSASLLRTEKKSGVRSLDYLVLHARH
jgi:hypothetical protein